MNFKAVHQLFNKITELLEFKTQFYFLSVYIFEIINLRIKISLFRSSYLNLSDPILYLCSTLFIKKSSWIHSTFQVRYNLQNGNNVKTSSAKSPQNQDNDSTFIAIPKRYRKVDVKYNKMGQDEFQFDNFNKTPLVGLEAVLPNAYCNAVIQVSISSNS